MLTIEFSRRLAYIGGIVTPLAETIRRWSTWQQTPANFFDDYLLGAFLIYGAWRTRRNTHEGQRFLVAAWAVGPCCVPLRWDGTNGCASRRPSCAK